MVLTKSRNVQDYNSKKPIKQISNNYHENDNNSRCTSNIDIINTSQHTTKQCGVKKTSSATAAISSARSTVASRERSSQSSSSTTINNQAVRTQKENAAKSKVLTTSSVISSARSSVANHDKVSNSSTSHPMPSATLHQHKQADVWKSGKKAHKTRFGIAYDARSIPCRINHGSIKNSLQWTHDPNTLDLNPLLVTCVEGFQETEHPFVFLSRQAFRELLQVNNAEEKIRPVLPQLINPLRSALMSSDDDVFLTALEATRLLSDIVGDELNKYLPKLMQQIHRKLQAKQFRSSVEDTLATVERNGGQMALDIIRSKIPTYISASM